MYNGKRIGIVVPAFNEELHIARVLRTLPTWVDRIWVVDDGSTDRTTERASEVGDARLTIIRLPQRRGVGAAIAEGYRRAFSANDRVDIACVMAGDGQMDPADLSRVLSPVTSGKADYVKGNRFAHREADRIPLDRALGNRVLSWMTRQQTGLAITDAQCGYTAISSNAARIVDLHTIWPGYGYPNQMLARLAKAKLRIEEVPVRPIYAGERSYLRLHHALFVVPWVILRGSR